MGKEVVYCFLCKTRLLSDQFEQNKAVQLVHRSVCIKCAKEQISSLSPEEQELVRRTLEPPPQPAEPPVPAPDPAPGEPPPRTKTPLPAPLDPLRVKPPTSRQIKTRRVPGRPASASPAVAIVGAGLLLAVVLALVMNSGSGTQAPRRSPDPSEIGRGPVTGPAPIPTSTPTPPAPGKQDPGAEPSRRHPAPPGPNPAREAAARDALEEAVRFARENPGDLRGIVKRFRSARWISEGTGAHDSVVKAGEPFERQMSAILDTCEREVEATARALQEQKRYRDLFTYLQNELGSFDEPDWTTRIHSRIDRARSDLNAQLRVVGEMAIMHAKGGRAAEALAVLKPLRELGVDFVDEEIAGIEARIESLAKSKPDPGTASPPSRRREPSEADRKAVQEAIEEAGRLGSLRSYGKAEEILAEAGRRVQDTPLAADLDRFREVLHRASLIFQALCQALSRAGGENEVEVAYFERPRSRTAKGRIVHVDDSVLHLREAKMGRDARVIPLELLEADFLLIASRAYLGNDDSVRRDLACFLAVDGHFDKAKTEYAREAAALPESVRSIKKAVPTGKTSRLSDTAEWKEREKQAEALYDRARKVHKMNPGAAIDDFKRLLVEYRETNYVDARLKEIQEIANRGREYVMDAQAFKEVTAGWKRTPIRAKGVRVAAVYEKDVEIDKPPTDWIDVEFLALAGTTYRVFFHVGGCCEASSSFRLQGDDMSVQVQTGETRSFPIGGSSWVVVRGLLAGSHGVHSAPTQWGWIPGMSISYPTGGIKRLRLAAQAKGAALSHVVISSERFLTGNPPPPNELENGQ
jgi:hypothetical protein